MHPFGSMSATSQGQTKSPLRAGARLGAAFLAVFTPVISPPSQAHFQELIPSTEIVDTAGDRVLRLDLRFTHPMAQGPIMPMAVPARFGVLGPGGRQDLRGALEPATIDGAAVYSAVFNVERPGDYVFFVEPAPYWEPAEGKWIVHYTKVVVDAFGGGGAWDAEIGLPVEIAPLVRPYGLWIGNLFRGVVKHNGQPVPFVPVEVEWRNDGSVVPPADAFETQLIKADANGTFAYAIPRAGWWGFAALLDAPEPMPGPHGEPVPVEQGGLIWVRARDMTSASDSGASPGAASGGEQCD
jgi:cobalt/nickel transport protein